MSEYKRLTEKSIGCFEYRLKDHKPVVGEFSTYEAFYDYSMAVRQLGKYEDIGSPEELAELAKAKAEGRLAILPCKLGTQVYCLVTNRCMLEHNRCFACKSVLYSDECRKTAHIESLFFEYNMISFIGETVFLTKEKAEAALKQIGVQNE